MWTWDPVLAKSEGSPRHSGQRAFASKFFTLARFEPDSIVVYSLFALTAIILFDFGFRLLAIVPLCTLALLFLVESYEAIDFEHPTNTRLDGAKCLVLTGITKSSRGVVKIIDGQGKLNQWELWSANSQYSILKGEIAFVKSVRNGLILEVEPIDTLKKDCC